jgi:hypothetical protein
VESGTRNTIESTLCELSIVMNKIVQSVQFGRNGTDKGFDFCYPKKESGNPLFLNNYG